MLVVVVVSSYSVLFPLLINERAFSLTILGTEVGVKVVPELTRPEPSNPSNLDVICVKRKVTIDSTC